MLAEDWLCVAIAMALSHLSALLEWSDRERVHQQRYGRRDGPV